MHWRSTAFVGIALDRNSPWNRRSISTPHLSGASKSHHRHCHRATIVNMNTMATGSTPSTTTNNTPATPPTPASPAPRKHYHCYCLRSLDPSHQYKTYIGFTTDPHRRIRQHNGILKNGGARRTKRAGRPWTFVLVLHGFPDKITALQFEWAWQHPDRSRVFRAVVGDTEAGKMHRRRGVRGKLDILRVLIQHCEPFCTFDLDVHFLKEEHERMFWELMEDNNKASSLLVARQDSLPVQMTAEVRQIEQMPFWVEMMESRERKKERRQRKRKNRKRVAKKKGSSSGSDGIGVVRVIGDEVGTMQQDDCIERPRQVMHDAASEDESVSSSTSITAPPSVAATLCHLCSASIGDDDIPITCTSCQMQTHVLCLADKLLEDCNAPPSVLLPTEGNCPNPSCRTHILWETFLEERRRIQIENGYFGEVGADSDDISDCDDNDDASKGSDDDDIVYLLEDEDSIGNDDANYNMNADTNLSSSPTVAAATRENAVGGSTGNNDNDTSTIDLVTPRKGIADMSISDSLSSPSNDVTSNEEENDNVTKSTDGIIDLTSP